LIQIRFQNVFEKREKKRKKEEEEQDEQEEQEQVRVRILRAILFILRGLPAVRLLAALSTKFVP
jgi:hypothetical protein